MTTHKIAVVGGDGIGPEVIAEALKVIDAAGVSIERIDYDLGAARYLRDGTVLPDEVLDEWRGSTRSCSAPSATRPPVWPHRPAWWSAGILLKMRFELDMYINLRPFRLPPRINCEVIRENTEGTYAGEGGFLRKGTPHEIATQGSVNTRFGVERCVRSRSSGRRAPSASQLHLVHKKNVLTFAGDLWQRTFDAVAAEYPRSPPATTTSTRRASTSSSGPSATTSSSPTTCSATSSPTSAVRSPGALAMPPRRTSTRIAPARRCSSRCTARRPTSPASTGPTPSPRS
jgi:isocitrate/isopropylmalate dehydrogenase